MNTGTPTALERLARILDVTPESLLKFETIDDTDLHTLTDMISQALFEHDAKAFKNISAISTVLPSHISGKLSERFLPAPLAARAAEHLEPAKAGDLVSKVSVSYLADIAIALNPERAANVITGIPPSRVGQVAAELFARDELEAMATFIGTVSDEALFAALKVATGEQLLRVTPLLDWTPQLESVLERIDDDHIDEVIVATVPQERWSEAAYLLGRLPAPILDRVAQRIAHASPAVRDALHRSVAAGILPPHLFDALTHDQAGST